MLQRKIHCQNVPINDLAIFQNLILHSKFHYLITISNFKKTKYEISIIFTNTFIHALEKRVINYFSVIFAMRKIEYSISNVEIFTRLRDGGNIVSVRNFFKNSPYHCHISLKFLEQCEHNCTTTDRVNFKVAACILK